MARKSEHVGIFTSKRLQTYLAYQPEIAVEPLGERLWTASDGRCRTIFAEGRNGVIAFDTFGTPGRARAYCEAIGRTVPDKPISTVVYSHDHLDHAGFAADLAPDAEIIADDLAAQVIRLRRADGQLAPTRTLTGPRSEIEHDGVSFQLLNPGPTHGSGNTAAYFPDRKLLFMVDTILPNARYGLLPDYHLGNFLRNMRSLLELDFETFVPGRYEVTDRNRFAMGCDYLEVLDETCQQAFAEFVPIWILEGLSSYVAPRLRERFGVLEGFEENVGLTAIRIIHHYIMGGWGLEDTPDAGVLLAQTHR